MIPQPVAEVKQFPSKFRSAESGSPDTFAELQRWSVVDSLNEDSERYRGDKFLSIMVFPEMCSLNVDRLKVQTKHGAGIHSVIACCLWRGIDQLTNNANVKDLFRLKYSFDSASNDLDGEISKTVYNIMSAFKISLPNGGERKNIRIPENYQRLLGRLSSVLGIHIQSLAVLAIVYTLSEQEEVNNDDRETMKKCVADFLRMVEIRVIALRALMQAFKIPIKADLSPVEEDLSRAVFYD